ncbi:MAG: N-acetylmuramoyl-L-alanine amidase [Spirochaetales bacterium]|nr:N-acetylmuramoyl-L-alanine amidase [Spirochaetales bacterium]
MGKFKVLIIAIAFANFLACATESAESNNLELPEEKNVIEAEEVNQPEEEVATEPDLAKYTIMIDPGHGGHDNGGIGASKSYEKDYNNILARIIERDLKNHGFKIIYSKNPDEDIFISPADRAEISNKANPDLFLSVHHNMDFFSNKTKGFTVYYSTHKEKDKEGTYIVVNGKKYDNFVRQEVTAQTTYAYFMINGKIQRVEKYRAEFYVYDTSPCKEAVAGKYIGKEVYDKFLGLEFWKPNSRDQLADRDFIVLRKTNSPSILIEAGFISHPEEEKIVTTTANQEKISKAVADGIAEYFKKLEIN